MDNVKDSIKRAQKLLGAPDKNHDYISIKIKPSDGRCCCFHCWPLTWHEINHQISRYGYLEDEGDIAIGSEDDIFVLECHESGPEIILYIGIGIASAKLVKSMLDVMLTLIKNRQQERRGAQFKITKRVIKNTKTFIAGSVGSFFIGIYSGFYGAGSGILYNYLLILVFRQTFLESTATRKIIGLLLSIAATVVFISKDVVDYTYATALFLGMCIGSYIGAHYSDRLGNIWIKRLFAVIVLIMAIKLLW